ncbi:MAG: diaminopimelate decarboxylase [Bacillota bacterium]
MNAEQLLQIAAQYGTPLYVFDTDALDRRVQAVGDAFGGSVRLCYSIKANPFLTGVVPIGVLEVCSPGELYVCRACKVPPEHILYSGVNKTMRCIEDALEYGVACLTAESPLHLARIEQAAAKRGVTVEGLLRLTGGDQFGMDEAAVRELVRTRAAFPHIRITGLHFFSGTQKRNAKIIGRELAMLSQFADSLLRDFGFITEKLEYGAGLFADYFGENAQACELQLLQDVAPHIRKAAERFTLTVEMGRFFTASCGYYLTTVEDVKTSDGKHYAIVDGGIHQINYDGLILAPAPPPVTALNNKSLPDTQWILSGSLCTRADILARGAILPQLRCGDILCFAQAGAYAITEGPALLLSRDIPAVVIANEADGAMLVRDHLTTHELNTRGS